MILKALYDYYHRKRDLPQFGRELKQIGFIIVIDQSGKFVRFEDHRLDKKTATEFLVKKHYSRSSAPVANWLYDNSAYVLGISDKGEPQKALKYLAVFKSKIEDIYRQYPQQTDLSALHAFYQQSPEDLRQAVEQDPLWETIKKELNKKYSTFSFRIKGDTQIVAEKDELIQLASDNADASGNQKICLISGKRDNIVELTTATMIPGSQAIAKLVAFQVNSGYDSYGKQQGANAPIGEQAEFAYSTALNHMLAQGSRNKFMVGNRTFVFWASSDSDASAQAETSLFDMLGIKDKDDTDNPDAGIEQVRKVFKAIYSGELKTSLDDRFYILGLAPNSARIAIVYWSELVLRDFATNMKNHFERMNIVLPKSYKKLTYMGLRTILSAVTLGGNSSEVTPNLPEAIAKSVFEDTTYPISLFTACLCRLKTDSHDEDWDSFNLVDNIYKVRKIDTYIARFAIIKAFINKTFQNDIKEMLDKQNTNQGYLCGRLFAILERIQEISNRDKEYFTNVRSRYMSRASSEPAVVFPTMLSLSVHHSEKIENIYEIVKYEKLKQEIIDNITDFPAHLSLHDQGRFFVGYYHQRQALFVYNEEQTND